LHGLYYLPLVLRKTHRKHTGTVAAGRMLPSFVETLQMATTFVMVLVAWVFFRADSFEDALRFLAHMATDTWLVWPRFTRGLPYVFVIVMVDWAQRTRRHGLDIAYWPQGLRWAAYYLLVWAIFSYGHTGYAPFIYFQF
jgi:hypothetical protein